MGNAVAVAERVKRELGGILHQDTELTNKEYTEFWDPLEEGLDM